MRATSVRKSTKTAKQTVRRPGKTALTTKQLATITPAVPSARPRVFDYDSVDLTDRTLIQERAIHIHALLKTSREGVAEIGECLVEVKSRLEHGKWLPWLKHEFGTNGAPKDS